MLDALYSPRRDAGELHSGGIETELGRDLTEQDRAMFQSARDDGRMTFKSVEAGAATQVWAAMTPELEGVGGSYLEDCHVAPVDDHGHDGGVRSWAIDPQAARTLWERSEQMVGQVF